MMGPSCVQTSFVTLYSVVAYAAGDSGASQKAETASQKAPGRDASQKASGSEAVTEPGEYFFRASAVFPAQCSSA